MDKLNEYLPQSVKDRNILITGATTGIGRATALLLSELGAHVMVVGLNEQHLEDTLKDLYKVAKGEVFDVIADLSTAEGIGQVFSKVDSAFDTLDILVNNVALPFGSITEGNYEGWQRVVNTNLLSYMACCNNALTRMRNAGHIVNIGSMSADVREESGSVYVATKSGIQGFSESLRKQVNKDGIKVTLIEPGAVDTDMQDFPTEEKLQKVESLEMLTADDIAASVLYCLSQPQRCDVVNLKIRPHLQLI
jgi:NADP-dependent 3-hydroxy acid dehydrogenase YdfG